MANAPQMKIPIGAETKDFEKGAKKVKQEMRDLNKVSSDAFSAIGSAVGVDTGKLQQFSNALQGLGNKFSEMGSSGAQALGGIIKAAGPAATAIAGLGIGAAVLSFKALKAEADAFGNTIDGLNLKLSTQAYIDTYRQALHDANADTGKSVGEAMANWQKGWARFKSNVAGTFVQWVAGEDTVGLAQAWKKVSGAIDEATAAAERNEERGNRLADVMKEELKVRKEVADIDVRIAELRRTLRDRSLDAATRSAAENEVRALINTKMEKQSAIARELYQLQAEMTAEAGSSYEDERKVVELYERMQGLLAANADQLAQIDRYSNSIKTNTEATAKAAVEVQPVRDIGSTKAIESMTINTPIKAPVELILPPEEVSEFKEHMVAELGGGWTIAIAIDPASVEKIQDISGDLKGLIQDMAFSMSEAVGNLFADLATGEDAWGNFAHAALSSFGDMAISVGKIAIEMALASEGIKAALKLGNPFVALAAGAALVILGTAVKNGLSNVASGNYSAGANMATSSATSSFNGSFEQREVYMNVTGVLKADGDQLLAVITNAEKKQNLTT